MKHKSVLTKETVEALTLKSSSVVVDATFGSGGHAREICKRLDERGVYIGIDVDPIAIQEGEKLLSEEEPKIHLVNKNFSNLDEILRSLHIESVDAVMADLGWRSEQFSNGGKGLSFLTDEPLLMTFGNPEDYLFNAYDIVNHWAEEDIANVLYGYAEERNSRRIARAIVEERKVAPIETSAELASLVRKVNSNKPGKIDPATKTFQALRIAVNDELNTLEKFLSSSFAHLAKGGRLAVITFHSLEDRIVKQYFRDLKNQDLGVLITRKPIVANLEEKNENQRSRSAKLRVIEKA
jgi:16S rRNA (cytosine1402-N4)-methyltransferase